MWEGLIQSVERPSERKQGFPEKEEILPQDGSISSGLRVSNLWDCPKDLILASPHDCVRRFLEINHFRQIDDR